MEQQRAKYVIPVGYVFRPEPEELLGFLVESIKLGDEWIGPPEIRNLDLYDKDSNPWTLFDGSSEKPYYVMTRLEKKVTGKSKFKRTAGIGTWKEQKSSDVAFRFQDGVKLKGLKRYFAFVINKGSSKEHGRWIMNEYSLPQDGFDDYVICEIHKKASKRKHDDDGDDTQNQVVVKKMRSTALISTPTPATSAHDDGDGVVRVEAANDDDVDYLQELVDLLVKDDTVPNTPGHQEVVMTKTQSSTCDDDDQELINLIESEVEGGVDDIAACDSLATVSYTDHDRRGMISIQSVSPFEGHGHHYPSSSFGDHDHDHDLDSIMKTDSCIATKQSYPPSFVFSAAGLPVHWQESATSTRDRYNNYIGSPIVDGSDDSIWWDELGF